MAGPLVELRGIAKTYGSGEAAVHALKDTDLCVHPGQVVGLLGPSGSGKTTLLNLVGCIVEPTRGRMTLDGETVYDGRWLRADLRRLRLEKIGFIFQFHNLLPFLTAEENVAVVLDLAGVPGGEARRQARALLDYLEVGHRRATLPARLSGGEAQRVAIARALAKKPKLIFADEPTSALDGENGHVVMDLLRKCAKEQGATVLCVTHDARLAAFADRIITIEDGRITSTNADPAQFAHHH